MSAQQPIPVKKESDKPKKAAKKKKKVTNLTRMVSSSKFEAFFAVWDCLGYWERGEIICN